MIELLIIAAYVSLALELVLIPVPSVASARSLSAKNAEATTSQGRSLIRLYAPVILNILVFCIPLLQALAGLYAGAPGRETPWSVMTGLGTLLLLGGRVLTVASAREMRRALSVSYLEGTTNVPLRTSGLFARSRNPGLLGMYAFAFGILLLQPNGWFAIGLIHYLWHMHRKVEIEERFLQNKYGPAYADYLVRTRRYV